MKQEIYQIVAVTEDPDFCDPLVLMRTFDKSLDMDEIGEKRNISVVI